MTDKAVPVQEPRSSKNRSANQAALRLLCETYPLAFDRTRVRPLKVGIQEDLLADARLPANRIKRALASYVRSPHYHKAMRAGAQRVDLAGNPAGEVTESAAAHAREMLARMRQEKRQREQQAREEAREKARAARLDTKLNRLVNKPSNA